MIRRLAFFLAGWMAMGFFSGCKTNKDPKPEIPSTNSLPDEIARELGLTIGAAYSAKSRVLRKLRREAAGLVGELVFS